MAISRPILKQLEAEAGQRVELDVKDETLIIKLRQRSRARSGWKKEVVEALLAFANDWRRVEKRRSLHHCAQWPMRRQTMQGVKQQFERKRQRSCDICLQTRIE